VTQIANGLSTTTFTYDNNGNVTQKTTDGTTTTYVYDYANRLTALGAGGATTTYAYDAFGQRVLQTGTTTTYLYPFKWYSVASSTGSGAKFATTTDYLFNGDSMVATIDQQTASGNATGTAKTRYVHPDHLGSTNLVTDENGNVVQTLDFYPYGGTRISSATSTNERRKYTGQFADDSSLSYLQARYYDAGRGQFISQDPVFWESPKGQDLKNPQSLNSYSYANDNPITGEDPTGCLTSQSPVNITRNLLADLISLANNLTAFVNSLTHNPVQSAQSAGQSAKQTVQTAVANPSGFVYGVASGVGQSVGRTWNQINSGSDAQQERGITNLLEFEGGVIGGATGADEVVTGAAGQTAKVTDIIKGFNHDGSYHGLDQIINRGVTSQMLKETVTNPLITTLQPTDVPDIFPPKQ
jgi:RHS repeat-associated protein